MKDEIKEILDILNRMAKENKESDNPLQATVILFEILYKVLDYITNLQKENERLKVNCNLGYEELKVMRDYKSRCEKLELENKVLKEQMVAMAQPNYVYGLELQGVGKDE